MKTRGVSLSQKKREGATQPLAAESSGARVVELVVEGHKRPERQGAVAAA
jgi:hypothetical protein